MDVNAITTMIGSLGFPICVAIYMIYVNQKESERHAEEATKMTDALNELKIAINTLVTKLSD